MIRLSMFFGQSHLREETIGYLINRLGKELIQTSTLLSFVEE